MSGYLAGIVAVFSINLLLAYSVFLPAAAGMLNLGAAGFMAVGAYTSAWLDAEMGWPLPLCILAATAASLVVGALVAIPLLRTRGVYMVLATLAFGEIVAGILINLDAVGGAAGYPVTSFVETPIVAAAAAIGMLLVIYLLSTRFGLAMRSIHDDEQATALFGINVRKVKVIAFGIGAGFGGLAGALYGHHYNYIEVANFNLMLSTYTLLYVLIGGTQTAFGPLVGAAIFSLLPEVLRGSEHWRFVIFAVMIIAVMALRPEGVVTRHGLARLFGRRAAR
ncbi:branched-chain amino acid ABC transporter permease [Acetobacteraceae bacterium H6797]|nr:branched-chain amino acid ABC transporter permease [Acetobacteraceae bacterium H6797]